MDSKLIKPNTMIVEELLKPRIKVTADFWENPFDVGQIVQFEIYKDYYDGYTDEVIGKDWSTLYMEVKRPNAIYSIGTSIVWNLRGFLAYPHLFKPLEWWEDREEKDLPKYAKVIDSIFNKKDLPYYAKVDSIINGLPFLNGFILSDKSDGVWCAWKCTEPATKEEYENQNG